MDEQKPKSSWDDLLKEIGAAPPPDALERKRPAIETTFEPPPEVNVEAVKPKAGDWNALASDLGIEVKEEPARKAPEPTSHAGPSSNALEASFTEIEPMESDFEDVVEDEIADIDFGGDEGDEEEEDEDDFLIAKRKPEPDPNALSGDAARNAFESLFQAGSFAALPPLKKPEPVEPPRQRGGPQWRELEESRSEGGEEEIVFEEITEAEAAEGEESVDEERGRPRRRRRRRRGRGRDGERGEREERAAAPRAEEDDEELSESADQSDAEEGDELEGEAAAGELGEKPTRRRRRRRRRGKGEAGEDRAERAAANGRSAADDEEDDDQDEEASSGGDEEDETSGAARESHKNIPTWSDAISVMVEVNLQSRKNAPSRPSGPRERGRGGRGRGRGGSGRRGKS
ncbi:MAG TPA: hypothetical protein VF175_18345 [Lacipirellula sp.]